jgi:type 1 glutamine amidotransferase
MKEEHMRSIILPLAAAMFALAQTPTAPKSVRPADSKRIPTSVTGLLGWRVATSGASFRQTGFLEAAAKTDALGLAYIEGFSTQKVSAEIPKNLDYHLASAEVEAVKSRLADLKMKIAAYHVDTLGPDESGRLVFTFAKSLGVETIIANPERASLPAIDQLANEFGINVALNAADPKGLMNALEARSNRIGASADVALWVKQGVKPSDGVAALKDRLLAIDFGRTTPGLGSLLLEMERTMPPPHEEPDKCFNCSRRTDSPKAVAVILNTTTAPEIAALEKALRPAMGDRVEQITKVLPITSVDHVPPEDRQKIDAAVPRQAIVKPSKPRKLLVVDLCPAGGYYHETIAYANLMLQLMAKYTGAFEPVFSNDLNNLKYPKIKEFDAVFLNSVVGEVFPDPDVMNGLMRFVREGGGVAGIHGATYASQDVPEFGELMGAQDGPHHVEPAVLRVEDASSPITKMLFNSDLTKALGGSEFAYTDEFYHFLPTGPYSRDKLHILISVDTSKSDMSQWHVRPDNDYGLSWIKSYGKGRVFNCAFGHTHPLYETPALSQFLLASIQFVLGDLNADTTPSARLGAKK